jgi:hypothetical protein
MGLIKTAIMTGGGLYAVNKIAKAAEHRNGNRQQAPPSQAQSSRAQQDSYPQQQGYWGPPPPGYHQDQQQGQQSPSRGQQQYIAASEYEQPQYFSQPQQQGQYQDSRSYYQPTASRGLDFDYVGAPGAQQQSYSLRNQRPQGFVRELSESDSYESRGRSSSARGISPDQIGDMMKMATDFIGRRK